MESDEIEAHLDTLDVYERFHRLSILVCADPFSDVPCRVDQERLADLKTKTASWVCR